jgi:hypothetical protein
VIATTCECSVGWTHGKGTEREARVTILERFYEIKQKNNREICHIGSIVLEVLIYGERHAAE